jgi:hypothetical protein
VGTQIGRAEEQRGSTQLSPREAERESERGEKQVGGGAWRWRREREEHEERERAERAGTRARSKGVADGPQGWVVRSVERREFECEREYDSSAFSNPRTGSREVMRLGEHEFRRGK